MLSILSKTKELFGFSWNSAINCLGALCGWLFVVSIMTHHRPFAVLNYALCWLGLTNINILKVESYLQHHAALFYPLAVLLLLMSGLCACTVTDLGELFGGTYGAIFWIGLFLLFTLKLHLFSLLIAVVILSIAIGTHAHSLYLQGEKLLSALLFVILLTFVLLYPILLLARIAGL